MSFQAKNASVQSIVIMGEDGTDGTLVVVVIVIVAPLDLCGKYFHGGMNRALANGTLPIQVIAQAARTLHTKLTAEGRNEVSNSYKTRCKLTPLNCSCLWYLPRHRGTVCGVDSRTETHKVRNK